MTNKKIILDKLIECNPDISILKELTVDNFDITEIQSVAERTANGVKINSRVRLICDSNTGWVGSRFVWFYRDDANTAIPEQARYFDYYQLLIASNTTNIGGIRLGDIVADVFKFMNLEFDDSWIVDPDKIIDISSLTSRPQGTLEYDVHMTNESLFFTGSFSIFFSNSKFRLGVLPNPVLDLWEPLYPHGETRINLTAYSFDFRLYYSDVVDSEKIKDIKSQKDLEDILQIVINVISEFSGDEWSTTTSLTSPTPGGYFKFIANETVINAHGKYFDKNTMFPINRDHRNVVLLELDLPENSQSNYFGIITLYY